MQSLLKPLLTRYSFTYEGHLNLGEFKLSFDKSDGWNNMIQAPVADCEFNHDGPAKQGMVVGGDDNKWKVTEAGTYTDCIRPHKA